MEENYILRIKLSQKFWQGLQDDQDDLKDIKNYMIFLEESCENENIYTDLRIDFQDGYDIKTFIETTYKECKELKELLLKIDQDAFNVLNIERVC